MALRNQTYIPTLRERLAPPTYATGKQSEPVLTSSTLDIAPPIYAVLPEPLRPRLPARNRIKGRAHCQSGSQFHTVHIV